MKQEFSGSDGEATPADDRVSPDPLPDDLLPGARPAGDLLPGERPGDPPPGTFAPFRYPVFRAIWIANLVSNLGGTMQAVGAAWLMTELTTSRELVALVQTSTVLPILMFGLIAGAIADNYDRRQVMLLAQAGMLVVALVLAVLAQVGWVTPSLLLIATLGVGVGTALNAPAWQASVRQQVPTRQLPQAITLNAVSYNIARSIGPALGGLVMVIWGVSAVFALNAISYLGIIAVLLWWRPPHVRAERQPILPAIMVGLRYTTSSWALRAVLLRGLVLGIALVSFPALLPSAVKGTMAGSETQFGILLGMFGLGSIITAPMVGPVRKRHGLEGIIQAGVLAFALALVLLALARGVALGIPAALLAGGGWVCILVTLNTAMQVRSPDAILGRCLSVYQAVTFGGMALGSWLWGALADRLGIALALYACASSMVLLTLLMRAFVRLPRPGEALAE